MDEAELLALLRDAMTVEMEQTTTYVDRENGNDSHSYRVRILWRGVVVCEAEAV